MPESVWFTSDTHFWHAKQAVRRGYLPADYKESMDKADVHQCLHEMNRTIVERWNKCVRPSDRVYHLGDVFFGTVTWAASLCEELNGHIYLVRGNHDTIAEHKSVAPRFEWIKDYARVKIGDQKIYLCHYAFRTWNCMHHGSWNLHGHSHGSLEEYPDKKQLDVGVDCWSLAPVSFEQIKERMDAKQPFVPVDHH